MLLKRNGFISNRGVSQTEWKWVCVKGYSGGVPENEVTNLKLASRASHIQRVLQREGPTQDMNSRQALPPLQLQQEGALSSQWAQRPDYGSCFHFAWLLTFNFTFLD